MDDYGTDLNLDDETYEDVWEGEDEIKLQGIPAELWSEHPVDKAPPLPDKWIDDLADQVEIKRLCEMKVLVAAEECADEPTGKLTTKFVRD